ncbi:MAG: geranylgeranyl reductase family protein [Promethearchaeota archaeon]
METEEWDVVVVGAGPGGSWAGMELAKADLKVKIIEKEKLAPRGRYKACGGAMAWELVDEVGYPEDLIAREIQYLDLHHVDGESFHKAGRGAVVWRSVFDKYLTDKAVGAGAALSDRTELVGIEDRGPSESPRYSVKTRSAELSTKYVVAADGVASRTLRLLGFPRFRPDQLCMTNTREVRVGEEHITKVLGSDRVHLFFGVDDLVPVGYSWLFPKEDTISVGWGNLMSRVKNVRQEFAKFLDLPLVREALEGGEVVREKAHLIPVSFRDEFARDGVLGVGDAAGCVDPISGKGIPYAMMAGGLAARAIKYVEKRGKPEVLAKKYANSVNSRFGGVLRRKLEMRRKIFLSDDNVKTYLGLWERYRSSEILARGLF